MMMTATVTIVRIIVSASTYYLAGTLQVTYFLSFSFLMCKVKKTAFNPTVRL